MLGPAKCEALKVLSEILQTSLQINLFEGMTKTKDATLFSILPLVSGLPLKTENKTNKKASKE